MKKLLIGAAMLAAVFAFTGCVQDFGPDGDNKGTKWNKTMTVDATELEELGDPEKQDYSRYWSELSTSKEVAAFKTTIEIFNEDTIENKDGANAVVGLVFDAHETKVTADDGSNDIVRDFVLIGYQPATNRFYIERYENISSNELKEGLQTETSSMGSYKSFVGNIGSMTLGDEQVSGDWKNVPNGWVTTNEDGNKTFTIEVKQDTPGTYTIFFGNTKIGTYNGTVKNKKPIDNGLNSDIEGYDNTTFAEKETFAVGGMGIYGNCPTGTKLKVKYSSDKTKTYGLFIDEE